MSVEEDFRDHPVSLSEVRSLRDGDPGVWSPRDVIIHLLREIDSGNIELDHVFIAYGSEADGVPNMGFVQGGKFGPFSQMGLLTHAIQSLANS